MRYIIAQNVGLAWLFNVSFSLLLVGISAASVLWISPAAAGSGVPEVMAYLNGCSIPKMFFWKTSAIKFLSCACCVGAGLPVGPEGPMIFLGATLGGLVSQGTVNFSMIPPSEMRLKVEDAMTKAGVSLWPFRRFRNKCSQRDFMTAGCAAGVAGAFGAPIGGLLFAMEEVASFWSVTLGWEIFFACMTAVFARAFAESLYEGETPGLFMNTIAYEQARGVSGLALLPRLTPAAAAQGEHSHPGNGRGRLYRRSLRPHRRAVHADQPEGVAMAQALRGQRAVEALCGAHGVHVHLLHHCDDAALRL